MQEDSIDYLVCGECRYFRERPGLYPGYSGVCKRYPPAVPSHAESVVLVFRWPGVCAQESACGEFKPKA